MFRDLIGMSVPDNVYLHIKGATHAKDMWDQLKGMFEGRSRTLSINAWRKLQNMRCKEDEDVRTHFHHMQESRERLASMGKSISEEDFASMLIASLPPSYDELIESFTTTADMNKTDITPDLVYKRVCDAYDKHLLRQETSGNGQDESFAASTQKSKSKKDIECYNCRKKGHIKADCWAKGGGKEGQGPRRRQGSTQANAAAVSEKPEDESWAIIEVINDEDDTMAATTTTTTTRTDDRSHTELYDSGAS